MPEEQQLAVSAVPPDLLEESGLVKTEDDAQLAAIRLKQVQSKTISASIPAQTAIRSSQEDSVSQRLRAGSKSSIRSTD